MSKHKNGISAGPWYTLTETIGDWLDELAEVFHDWAQDLNRVPQPPEYRVPYDTNPYNVSDEVLYLAEIIYNHDSTWDDDGLVSFHDAVERDLCPEAINAAAAVIKSKWAPR